MFLGIFKYFLVATPLENMCKYPRTHLKLFATDFLLGKQKFHGDNKRCQPRLTFLCNKILLDNCYSSEKFFPNSCNCSDFDLMEKCALITMLCEPLPSPSRSCPKGALLSVLGITLPYPSKNCPKGTLMSIFY